MLKLSRRQRWVAYRLRSSPSGQGRTNIQSQLFFFYFFFFLNGPTDETIVSIPSASVRIYLHFAIVISALIALCPNNSEVHIYRMSEDKWERVHVLQKKTNLLLVVEQRLSVYATMSKRIIGRSLEPSYLIFVWVSKLVRKRHNSSVTSVAWHPNNVLFVSEKVVIGVGFDCIPMVFAADESGIWSFVRFIGETKTPSSAPKYGSQFSEAFGKFYSQSKYGVNNDGTENSRQRGGIHQNCINCILPLKEPGVSMVRRFSTSGLDGKVVIWDLENQDDLFQ
ncbi:hypothetical protein CDL15_Pgr002927 [Punica granatum]|uniref:Actin-related protein 2/3 complex subunit 1A-like n=1 Tax=Punica granatum TaxID=22663 RepID=A0A218X228_PUNGR|nr:hypothetical protein CDL15_Pgr002927 [Punica granatum]